jgi:beta-lactamase superfamily II metal-dependent hydrolase
VLSSLDRSGARTLRTDERGTIVVKSDGYRITYEAGGETWAISRK